MAENKPVQIDVSRVAPIFADEALVISRVKAKKNENGKYLDKEGFIELVFLDQISQPPRAISRVVVSKNTADGLQRILSQNVSKLEAELKSKKIPKQEKIKIPKAEKAEKRSEQDYLG